MDKFQISLSCLPYFPFFGGACCREGVPKRSVSIRDNPALFWRALMNHATGEWRIFYVILTCGSIRICIYHLFHVTLLVQSNKRSAFPHNGHSPAFIVTPPSLSLISTGRVPFTQRGMTLLPKGVRTFCLQGVVPFCLKGSYPFAQRGRTLLPKGVVPFCPKGSHPFA